MKTLGRKEVAEQVLVAVLIAAATGLVNWSIEALKSAQAKRAAFKPAAEEKKP